MYKFLKNFLILGSILFFIYIIGDLFFIRLKSFYIKSIVRNFVQEVEIKYVSGEVNDYDEEYINDLIKREKDQSEEIILNIEKIEGINNFKISDLKEFAYSNKELDLDIKVFNLDFLDNIFK